MKDSTDECHYGNHYPNNHERDARAELTQKEERLRELCHSKFKGMDNQAESELEQYNPYLPMHVRRNHSLTSFPKKEREAKRRR